MPPTTHHHQGSADACLGDGCLTGSAGCWLGMVGAGGFTIPFVVLVVGADGLWSCWWLLAVVAGWWWVVFAGD